MFIVAKRNYRVRRTDGSFFLIAKDFIGNIPQDVAQSNLVQRAIRGGMIAVPEGTKDKQLEQADREAGEKAAEKDVRPDAEEKTDTKSKEAAEEQSKAEGNEADNAENGERKESGKRSQKK